MQKNQMLPRVIPFAIYILFLACGEILALIASQWDLQPQWLYLVRIIAVIVALIYFLAHFIELNKMPPPQDFLYAGVSGLIVFLVWILPYPSWLIAGTDSASINPLQGLSDVQSIVWLLTRIMGAALVVPIMEELFWRSYLMRRLDNQDFLKVNPELVSSFAYVASACIFALEHNLWLAGLFAGLVYGELYKTYKNLWIPIFAHAVTNGVLAIWVLSTGQWHYW